MDNTAPLVSVIIPSYNRRDSIAASVESVLRQSFSRLEVIVVDDGSDDGTEELFAGASDGRVRFFRYEGNRGACHARNYGAERASGALIAFQDSDDIWHADKLEKQLAFMERTGADFVFCGINRVSAGGREYFYPVSGFDNGGDALGQFLLENRAGTQTMLMKRAVWESVRFDESFKRYQDWDFALRVAARWRMAFLNEALVDSRVSGSSISASVSAYPALCHLLEKHREEFDSRPECLARLYRRMGNRLLETEPAKAQGYYFRAFRLEKTAGALLFCLSGPPRALLAKIRKGRIK